ncbi:MAG: hypothetical protein RLZZ191_239 [Pseudomonadota bacterium]
MTSTTVLDTPESVEQAHGLVDRLEEVWSSSAKEVAGEIIGRDVMHALKMIDEVSYIRFASVYKDFSEAKDFEDFAGSVVEAAQK